jgi:3-deoxy-D-manno-octulosonate 8-phosphate phosphatase (KDO 8-P phosphatase)
MSLNFKGLLQTVKAFVFDIDGVFSHHVFLHPSGELMRSLNVKDGFAVQYAVKKGFPVAIISGAKCNTMRTHFEHLGITDIYLGSSKKIDDFNDFLQKYQLGPEHILYMGDDIPDYEIMKEAGIPTCPSDAADEIKSVSVYISHKPSGEGCVRDVIEQTLRVQELWMDPEAFSW